MIKLKSLLTELKDGDRFGNWTVLHFHPSYDSMRILRGGDFTIQNRIGRTGHADGDIVKVEYDGANWRTAWRGNEYEGVTPEALMSKLTEGDRL